MASTANPTRADFEALLTDLVRAYRSAWDGLASAPEYRRIVQAKLNALGFDPESASTSTQE